jgi:hypothetical protein
MTSLSERVASTVSHVDPEAASLAARGVDLMKTYGKGDAAVRALDGVSVEFERGHFTAVMGPSGSGKSTLMHAWLLRVVGASRRQLFRSVLSEAALVGVDASVIGLGLGVLAALGLTALLGAFGVTLPSASLVFEPRTAVVGLAVGVGVTVVSAIGPARRAVRIAPVAALVESREDEGESLRRRVSFGGAVAVGGIAALAAGLAAPAIALVGSARWPCSSVPACSRRSWPGRSQGRWGGRWPPCSVPREGWDERTRCAARGVPPRPPPP